MSDDALKPIGVDEAAALLERGAAILLDFREPSAFAASHPAPARNRPIGALAAMVDELRAGPLVITSCGGGSRGRRAAALLSEQGIEARPLQGGLRAWSAAGLPTSTS